MTCGSKQRFGVREWKQIAWSCKFTSLPVCAADPKQSVSNRTGVDFTAADKQHTTHSSYQPSSVPTTQKHTHEDMSNLTKLAQTILQNIFVFL